MITCTFEDGGAAKLRHAVTDNILLNKESKKILLVRRANVRDFLEPNKLGLPGGYFKRDETAKQAALREIMEETGYEAEIKYLLRVVSNPNRPKEDRQNVCFVFVCEALEKKGEHDFEIQNTEWFDLDKLPAKEKFAFDHYENVQLFLRYQKEHFYLPVLD